VHGLGNQVLTRSVTVAVAGTTPQLIRKPKPCTSSSASAAPISTRSSTKRRWNIRLLTRLALEADFESPERHDNQMLVDPLPRHSEFHVTVKLVPSGDSPDVVASGTPELLSMLICWIPVPKSLIGASGSAVSVASSVLGAPV
jgi:hypothetical protein